MSRVWLAAFFSGFALCLSQAMAIEVIGRFDNSCIGWQSNQSCSSHFYIILMFRVPANAAPVSVRPERY
jgi:hypothetical protein